MIEPSPGRDDLEYRYHVLVETDALLDSEQQEYFRNGPECAYLGDPDFESEFPDLDWVHVRATSCARHTAEEAGRFVSEVLGATLKFGKRLYCVGTVPHVDGLVLCRADVSVRHEAVVPCDEWCGDVLVRCDGLRQRVS